jgi:D-alanyl-D-alanine carboxypeptidase
MKKTLSLALLLTAWILSAAVTPEVKAKVDKLLSDIQVRYRAASISVVAVRDDQIAYVNAFGKADIGRGIAAKADTRYRIASISKSFAASALMKL